ncbi:MAG TPA: MG2 domain-containing protein [Thermoanaerobaculia bacterium]|nr:MG2 domain-containing protein [Thermoanaerobaculia bacterium]
MNARVEAARPRPLALPPLFLSLSILLLLAPLVGCRESPSAPAPADAADPAVATRPFTAAELAPIVRPAAMEGGWVERLAVVLARPALPVSRVGREAGSGTRLEITPPVAGTLRVEDPSTLSFVPERGFLPGVTYQVRLAAVETASGVVEEPAEGWRASFTPPALELVRLGLVEFDADRRQVEVDAVFNAPVEAEPVRRLARWAAVGPRGERRERRGASAAPTEDPRTVRFALRDEALRPGVVLELELVPGQAGREVALAAGQRASVELGAGPELEVLVAHLEESASGFSIQVICDDGAVEGRRWYWDGRAGEGYQLSSRCQLADGEVERVVQVEPPARLSAAPAAGGFKLLGDLERGVYSLRIDAGARSDAGSVLRRTWEGTFAVPARSPQLAFQVQGRYLPRSAWDAVPVRHLNVEQAELEIRHVPPENLVFWMADDESERADERDSNLVAKATVPLRGTLDEEATTFLDLGSHLPSTTRGLVEVRLVAPGAAAAATRVVLTDLLLVAKRGPSPEGAPEARRPVVAWALDAHSLRPISGVDLRLVRRSGEVLASCRSRADRECRLDPEPGLDPSPPFALVATRDRDVTYLKFSELEVEIQEARVAGVPYREPGVYRAAVYTERGVYRPGEVAHLAAIVRDEQQLAPQADMPVELTLLDPRGKAVRSLPLRTNPAGFVHADLEIAPFAPTGRWRVRLTAADRQLGEERFQVEEFVPERMAVTVAGGAAAYLRGQTMGGQVAARYLFGGVPAGAAVELICELAPAGFAPERNAEYHYGVWAPEERPRRPLPLGTAIGELDGEGTASLDCPGDASAGMVGPAELVLRAAVAEAGSGRTSVGEARVPVHPERFYLGVKSGARALERGSQAPIEGLAVDWNGAPTVPGEPVRVRFYRLETEWGLFFDEAEGRETYRRYQRPVLEDESEVQVGSDGRFAVTVRPEESAVGYLVRATSGEAQTDLYLAGQERDWYWSPRDSEVDLTPRPGRPSWVAVEAPERVRVGRPFEVRFDAPWSGRALITLETDRLLESSWREVEAGQVVARFEVAELEPNVYVSVFLIKDPHLESRHAYLPDRAFGVQSVTVEPSELVLDVALDAPAEVRANAPLTVTLDVGPRPHPTFATVAAVDEGILSLTRFATPDPLAEVFPRRALGIETFETVGWAMLVPPAGPSSPAGGDVGGLLGRPSSIRPVALWSGLVAVPASGRLEVQFEVPEYQGALRVMAIVADERRLGRAEATVLVRDPLVLESTLPRFLTRGDVVEVPAFVTNLSGARREVEVRLEISETGFGGDLDSGGAIVEAVGDVAATLGLDQGKGGSVRFALRGLAPAGVAEVRVVARAGELESVATTTLPLLPRGARERTVQRVEVDGREAGDRVDLRPFVEGWEPLSERTTFWLTTNPYGDVFEHLDYLIDYPYGCLEQTASTTRPLLHLRELLPQLRAEGAAPGGRDVDAMVQAGVDRVLSMQTPSGGFAYWPGGAEPARWASAYALHLLLDARGLQYEVPAERIDDALDWMEREVSRGDVGAREDWYSSDAEPYMHYVLALAERPQRARVLELLSRREAAAGGGAAADRERERASAGEAREQRFLLMAAVHLAGDHRFESELRSPDLSAVREERSWGWSFYSDRRRRGLTLATYVDLFGRDEAARPLADLVAESLRRESRSYSTQELVWGITGLGKLLGAVAEVAGSPVLVANGESVEASSARPGDWRFEVARASEHRSLVLDLPADAERGLYLIVASEGVRAGRPERLAGGEGLVLRRTFRRLSGEPFDPAVEAVALGEVVSVELELANVGVERMTNLALVDRVPAGFEIENPRLGRERAVDWIDPEELWAVDHLDVRDDRIEAFGALERQQRGKLVYAVRATSAGRFTIPAVTAEAMYDPAVWARGVSSRVEIRRSGPSPEPAAPAAVGGGGR